MSRLQNNIFDNLVSSKFDLVRSDLNLIDVSYRDLSGITLLHEAVRISDEQLFKQIVDIYKDKFDLKDSRGATPLKYACCESGNLPKVKYLVEKGAEINCEDQGLLLST